MNLHRISGLAAAALLLVPAGCATPAATTSRTPDVVTLTLGTSEPEGRPTDDAMQDFASRVADLSHGSIVIERRYSLAPADHDWDHAFAQAFLDGEVDLAMVPARAWETVGVTSLAALQAPMLVSTDDLLDHVVTGDTAQTMLDGLGDVDTTGLALLPIGLRHLYFFGTPPTTVAEMAGRGVRGPQSPTVWAFLSALGMDPADPATSNDYAEAVRAGTLGAAETTYDLAPGTPAAATAVGNLVPYPYVVTLAASDAALAGLSGEQRTILAEAAAGTRDGLVASRRSDAEAAADYCSASHLAVVDLGPDELAAARRAAEPVYAGLEKDPGTKETIAAIRSIDDGLGNPGPDAVACDGRVAPTTEPNVPAQFPEGTYTADVTPAFLRSQGVDGTSALDNAQTWTMTFRDGTYDDGQCPGSTYTVDGGVLTVTLGTGSVQGCGSAAGQVLFLSGWHLDGDQMTFSGARSPVDTGPLIPALFGAQPFTKID